MINKKGAMFGLDARIALAIFGALSVISGAALYSAIQEAKVTALLSDMTELSKSWESFYLDTGTLPRLSSTTTDRAYNELKTSELSINSLNIKGWSGPYTSMTESSSGSNFLKALDYYTVQTVLVKRDAAWGAGTDSWANNVCGTDTDECYMSILINGIEDDVLAKALDKKIDSSDGGDAGRIRWADTGNATFKYDYFYLFSPVFK